MPPERRTTTLGSHDTKSTHEGVRIRPASEQDWPHIYPFFASIVAEGRTYAYPENLSSEEARTYWMADPPGLTVFVSEPQTHGDCFR